MENVENLLGRIRNEFSAVQKKHQQEAQQQLQEHQARQERLERLETVFDDLREVWRPRLEAFAKEFGDRVEAKPSVTPGSRQAALNFKSPLAAMRLKFSARPSADVTRLVVAYDLEILPILMEFTRHAEISFPLDQIDRSVLTQWLDDRMIEFVKTYLAVHENPYYLKGHMAEDPITGVRFPDFTAAATRQRAGRTYHFVSEETAAEFDKKEQSS